MVNVNNDKYEILLLGKLSYKQKLTNSLPNKLRIRYISCGHGYYGKLYSWGNGYHGKLAHINQKHIQIHMI